MRKPEKLDDESPAVLKPIELPARARRPGPLQEDITQTVVTPQPMIWGDTHPF